MSAMRFGINNAEAISGLEAEGEIACGEPIRHRIELGPGGFPFAREQGGLVPAPLKPDLKQRGERNGSIEDWSQMRHDGFLLATALSRSRYAAHHSQGWWTNRCQRTPAL